MRRGARAMVTLPFLAVIVTGNAGVALVAEVEPPAAPANNAASTAQAVTRPNRSRGTNPPFREGFEVSAEAAGLLTRGSPLHRLPGPEASGVVAERQLPSQRRDRPGLAPGSLTALRMWRRAYHSPQGPQRSPT